MARSAMGVSGIALVLTHPALAAHPSLTLIAFILILSTALAQALVLGDKWQKVEEALALPAVLIVGFGDQRVNILTLLWLGAVACGVLARGGRVHWIGSAVVMSSLALPIALSERLSLTHAALCLAVIALLLTCGRVTQELRLLLVRARWDADHDNLTKTLAPVAFRDRLDAQTPEGEGALLLVDLDNFGQINKSNGHAAGDLLLGRVGTLLEEQAGEDALVARLGGDEFGVATRALDPAALAKRIVAALGSTPTNIPASVGIASFPRDGRNADTLLRAADIALRIAKRAGRQQISTYAGDSLSDQGPGGAQASLLRLIEGETWPCPSSRSSTCRPGATTPSRPWPAFRPARLARCTGSPSPRSSDCAPSSSLPACAPLWPYSTSCPTVRCSASTCRARCCWTHAPSRCSRMCPTSRV